MIKIENLKKSFDGHQVLKGISFEVGKGEVFALVGGSGGWQECAAEACGRAHETGPWKRDGGWLGNRKLRDRKPYGFFGNGWAFFFRGVRFLIL